MTPCSLVEYIPLMIVRVSEISWCYKFPKTVVACHLQPSRDLTKLQLDLYNSHLGSLAFLTKTFLVSLCLVNGPYHYPSCQNYVVLQVSLCAGVNYMTMWASFLCGVTAGPIYILIHYVMIWCKGKQVLRARPNMFYYHQLLRFKGFESYMGN